MTYLYVDTYRRIRIDITKIELLHSDNYPIACAKIVTKNGH